MLIPDNKQLLILVSDTI